MHYTLAAMLPILNATNHLSVLMNRRHAAKMEPGIYDLPGTINGEPAKIAYDQHQECRVAAGPDAYGELEHWLRTRGVRIARNAAALFLACAVLAPSGLGHLGMRATYKRFIDTRRLESEILVIPLDRPFNPPRARR